eukprot:6188126-Pleurochrysis_carterae.AAC.7
MPKVTCKFCSIVLSHARSSDNFDRLKVKLKKEHAAKLLTSMQSTLACPAYEVDAASQQALTGRLAASNQH